MTDVNIHIAQNWNELTTKQIKNICYTLHCAQRSIVNLPEQKAVIQTAAYLNCIKELLRGNSFKNLKAALKELRIEAYQPFVKFLFEDVKLHQFPDHFKFKTTLYGPAFRLRNLTIEEFSFTDSLYFRFKLKNDVKYLNLLCSVLYRQKSIEPNPEDQRIPYSRLTAETNFADFEALPLKEKLPVLFAFEGSRNHLVSLYPNVFPKLKPNPNAKPKYTPFGELISAKIEYDPSKLKSANSTNAYTFFSVYENELKQIKKLKRKK